MFLPVLKLQGVSLWEKITHRMMHLPAFSGWVAASGLIYRKNVTRFSTFTKHFIETYIKRLLQLSDIIYFSVTAILTDINWLNF